MGYFGPRPAGSYDAQVFRGDVPGGEFVAFWTACGRVLVGMNVNVWAVTDTTQALVRAGRPVDPVRLADPAVSLADLHSDTRAGSTWGTSTDMSRTAHDTPMNTEQLDLAALLAAQLR